MGTTLKNTEFTAHLRLQNLKQLTISAKVAQVVAVRSRVSTGQYVIYLSIAKHKFEERRRTYPWCLKVVTENA